MSTIHDRSLLKVNLNELGLTLPPFQSVFSLSDAQIRSVFSPLWTLAPLSLVGSACIVMAIVRRKLHLQSSVYGRLMMGVSVANVAVMTVLVLSPLAVPRELLADFGSRGTTVSCTVTGLVLYIGMCVTSGYLVAMMIHFMLTICDNITETFVKQHLEQLYHGIVWVWCVVAVTVALCYKLFNPVGMVPAFCFLGSYPPYCHTKASPFACERGASLRTFLWPLMFAPAIVLALVFNISLFRIMHAVKKRANASFSSLSTFQYMKTVERQSFFYAINYFICYTFVVALPLVENHINPLEHEKALYRFQMAISVVLPSSGILNACTFFMPRYTLVARRNSGAPKLWILRQVILSKLESNDIRYQSTVSDPSRAINRSNDADATTERHPDQSPDP